MKRRVILFCCLFLFFVLFAGCQSLSSSIQSNKSKTAGEKFPESIYPPPVGSFKNPVSGGLGCPNLQGVEAPKPKSKKELFSVISRFGQTREGDLELSDQAFWPVVEEDWRLRNSKVQKQPRAEKITLDQIVPMPAAASPYADLIRNNCSAKTLELSWCVAVLPPGARRIEDAPSGTSYYYFIKRSGRWLIWFNPK
jgi:hypothetical protein